MPESTATFPVSFLSLDGQHMTWRAYLVLVLLCAACFLPGLTNLPPVDRDEPHFAQAAKQMIETGNYIDIRFQNETRYKKPIGIYWLQAASVKLLSPDQLNSIWAYRVPSFIGATAAVVMTAALGDLMFGPLTGLLAAVLMALCLVLNVEARLAKTDAMLLACIMTAQYALARAYMANDPAKKQSWPVCFAFWTAQSAGFLIKGPLLLLITFSTLLGLRLTGQRLGWLKSLRPALGLPYALLLIAPWFTAIMLTSHGSFAAQSAGHDMLAKIWQGQDRGKMPPGLHLLAFPVVFFPSSLLALLAVPDVIKQKRDPRIRFCLSWIIPIWIVFELSLTKLPHYVMPVYPAIALLAAHAALKGYPALQERKWHWITPAAFGMWFLVGAVLATAFVFVPLHLDQAFSPSGLLAAIFLAVTLIAFAVLYKKRSARRYMILAGGGSLVLIMTFGFMLPSLGHVWLSSQIAQVAERIKPCESTYIVSSPYNEPSLIFLAGTDTETVYDGQTVARIMKENPCSLGLVDPETRKTFLKSFATDPVKPVEVARLSGFNIGKGKPADLILYRLPAPQKW